MAKIMAELESSGKAGFSLIAAWRFLAKTAFHSREGAVMDRLRCRFCAVGDKAVEGGCPVLLGTDAR